MFHITFFSALILLCANAYCADTFDDDNKEYNPISSQTRFTPTTEISVQASLPRATNLVYYRGTGDFVDSFGSKHVLEFMFNKLLPAHLKSKIQNDTCKFYILSPSASTQVLNISYLLMDSTKDYSQPSLSFCLPKKIENKKQSQELYLEFDHDTGKFISILDQDAQKVDPTTLTLADIQIFRGASSSNGKISSDVNNADIALNLGNANTMDGVAYIGSQFTFKMEQDGQELDQKRLN
ncbi:MAG: hypothetical protein K2X98_02975 [Alphaproteobacteria bacterium]|nr:hypothetical protein [Alphaproteobacteria bacterium]